MKILLTGASGFLGRYLHAHLKTRYPQANFLETSRDHLDLGNPESLCSRLGSFEPDLVFHLAGVSRVRDDVPFTEYFEGNYLTTANLMKALEKSGKPFRMFFSSSIHVYGPQNDVANEESATKPANPYGFSKYLAEEALRDLCKRRPDLKVVIGRLYNCLGPGQAPGFVAADWCQKLRELPTSGGTLKVGSLAGMRYFLDVRDAVSMFPQLLDKAQPGCSVYNIASRSPTSLEDILKKLVGVSGKNPKVEVSDKESSNRFPGLKISTAKLEAALPGTKLRPLDETLREMYADRP